MIWSQAILPDGRTVTLLWEGGGDGGACVEVTADGKSIDTHSLLGDAGEVAWIAAQRRMGFRGTEENIDLCFLPDGAWLESYADAEPAFAVWLEGDIIGSGETEFAAVEAARKTVRGWT